MASSEQGFADLLTINYGDGTPDSFEGEWNRSGGAVDHGDESIVEPGQIWATLLEQLPTVGAATVMRPYSRIRDKALHKKLLAAIAAGREPAVRIDRYNRNADRSLDADPTEQLFGKVKSPQLPDSDANSGSAAMYTIECTIQKAQ